MLQYNDKGIQVQEILLWNWEDLQTILLHSEISSTGMMAS